MDIVTPQTRAKSEVEPSITGSYSKQVEIPYKHLWVYQF